MSNIKQLEGGRAAYAYECALKGREIGEKEVKVDNEFYKGDKYASYVKDVPMMIKTNGLGNTLAFLLSKGTKMKEEGRNNKIRPGDRRNPKNTYNLIYHQITIWFEEAQNTHFFSSLGNSKSSDLVQNVIRLKSPDYRSVTVEVLALFNWLKRFAEGLIEGEEND